MKATPIEKNVRCHFGSRRFQFGGLRASHEVAASVAVTASDCYWLRLPIVMEGVLAAALRPVSVATGGDLQCRADAALAIVARALQPDAEFGKRRRVFFSQTRR